MCSQRHTWGEGDVKRRKGAMAIHRRGRRPEQVLTMAGRTQPCRHPHLGLQASRTVRQFLLVKAPVWGAFWRRKWQLTLVFLPEGSQRWGSLVGCCLWSCTEWDTTEATQQQQQLWSFVLCPAKGAPGSLPEGHTPPKVYIPPLRASGAPPPGLEAVARLSNNPGLHSHGGLPWWLSREGICLRCKRRGFNPCVRKIPWRKEWQPTPVFLPGEFHGQRNLMGYSPWSHKESGTTDQLRISLFLNVS